MQKPDMEKMMDSFYRPTKKKEEVDRKTGKKTMVTVFPTANEKVRQIFIVFGVTMAEIEVHEREEILKGIILSRMQQTCPQCNGSGNEPVAEGAKFCTWCGGGGRVSNVMREKFMMTRLKGPFRSTTNEAVCA